MATKLITIGEILEMTPGDKQKAAWINDEFEAVVSDVKMGSGKAPNTAVLTDPHNSGIAIVGNFFGTDPSRFAGKVCHFSGKGMTRTEYKGTQQVTCSEKTTIQVVGNASPSQAPTGAAKQAAGVQNAEGQAIGNAITNAIQLLRESDAAQNDHGVSIDYLRSAEFSKDLWTLASDILRVSRLLNKGTVADPAKVRNEDPQEKAQREAAEKAAAEKAEAERKAKEEAERKAANQAPAGAADDSDVPF